MSGWEWMYRRVYFSLRDFWFCNFQNFTIFFYNFSMLRWHLALVISVRSTIWGRWWLFHMSTFWTVVSSRQFRLKIWKLLKIWKKSFILHSTFHFRRFLWLWGYCSGVSCGSELIGITEHFLAGPAELVPAPQLQELYGLSFLFALFS